MNFAKEKASGIYKYVYIFTFLYFSVVPLHCDFTTLVDWNYFPKEAISTEKKLLISFKSAKNTIQLNII